MTYEFISKPANFNNLKKEIQAEWYVLNSRAKKEYLIKLSGEQNHRCAYCGDDLILHCDKTKYQQRRKATIDHVIPVSEGGTYDYENLVAACAQCNSVKQSTNAYEFFAFINTPLKRKEILANVKDRKERNKRKIQNVFRYIYIIIWLHKDNENLEEMILNLQLRTKKIKADWGNIHSLRNRISKKNGH